MDQEALDEIAEQLSNPTGTKGIEIGEAMNSSNIGMTLATIQKLGINDGDVLLEIGHGNCGHLPHIIDKATDLSYHGLELSPTMHEDAIRKNKALMDQHEVHFQIYDSLPLPYSEDFFDKFMTVNTIYFINNPVAFLAEIYRILKPGGTACITFAQKEFMQGLPFVNNVFRLYNQENFLPLVEKSPFTLTEIVRDQDVAKTKTGETLLRTFHMAMLTKSPNE